MAAGAAAAAIALVGAAVVGPAGADSSVTVALGSAANEFSLVLLPAEVPAGDVVLVATNGGAEEHTLALKGGTPTAEIAPGGSDTLAVGTLAPGTYTFVCTIAGHEQLGMKADLLVTGADATTTTLAAGVTTTTVAAGATTTVAGAGATTTSVAGQSTTSVAGATTTTVPGTTTTLVERGVDDHGRHRPGVETVGDRSQRCLGRAGRRAGRPQPRLPPVVRHPSIAPPRPPERLTGKGDC